jgi:hypothetical protein
MSFVAGEITVRCPVCGWPVSMPVKATSVAGWDAGKTGLTCLTVQLEDARVLDHVCGPPTGDGREPVDRFVATGALDDHTLTWTTAAP